MCVISGHDITRWRGVGRYTHSRVPLWITKLTVLATSPKLTNYIRLGGSFTNPWIRLGPPCPANPPLPPQSHGNIQINVAMLVNFSPFRNELGDPELADTSVGCVRGDRHVAYQLTGAQSSTAHPGPAS